MRYALISKGLTLSQLEAEALKVRARKIKKARLLSQVFVELSEEQAERISQVDGLTLKVVREMKSAQMMTPEITFLREGVLATLANPWDIFSQLRSLFMPPRKTARRR